MPELMSEMELINALLKQAATRKGSLRPVQGAQLPPETTIGEPEPQGYDAEAGLAANLTNLLNYQSPGANPEVPTLKDAMLGVIMGAGGTRGSLGRTPGGGNARMKAPGGRVKDKARSDTLRVLRNVLEQTKENVRKNPEGVFPTKQAEHAFLKGTKIEDRSPYYEKHLAEVFGTNVLSDFVKANKGEFPQGTLAQNLKNYPPGLMRFDIKSIAKESKSPEDFARNLLGTLAHESVWHERYGDHSTSGAWGSMAARKHSPGRTIADAPPQAMTESPKDFGGQVQMDVIRNRMMETPLAEGLLRNAGIKGSPINDLYYKLKVGD